MKVLNLSVEVKTFSEFPADTGRKLNVLCTFSLRPVSTRLASTYFVTMNLELSTKL